MLKPAAKLWAAGKVEEGFFFGLGDAFIGVLVLLLYTHRVKTESVSEMYFGAKVTFEPEHTPNKETINTIVLAALTQIPIPVFVSWPPVPPVAASPLRTIPRYEPRPMYAPTVYRAVPGVETRRPSWEQPRWGDRAEGRTEGMKRRRSAMSYSGAEYV
jgi:hypothetical protein